MVPLPIDQSTRAWLGRVGLSLGIALGTGMLTYLVARAIAGVWLFARHQQLLQAVAGALRGGIEGLAGGDLRAVRLTVQQIDARNDQISLMVGFAAAAIAAVASYLWLERRAAGK